MKKEAIINPQNDSEECFKWAATTVLDMKNIKFYPERVSNLSKFVDNYDCSGLMFPVSTKDTGMFETEKGVSVNILAVEGRDIYIYLKTNYRCEKEIKLVLIPKGDKWHYTAINSSRRLLASRNSKHNGKQNFCTICSQGFT